MLSSLLRRFVPWTSRPSQRRRCLNRGPAVYFRPRLEELETRTAPATVTWTNAAGGTWETASNWSTGALPGPADDVVISGLNFGAVVTHASDNTSIHSLTVSASTGSANMTGGTLTLGSNSTCSIPLSISGGTISGPGNLTMASNAALNWMSGTMKGAGQTIANGGMTASTSGTKVLDGRTLTIPFNVSATVMDNGAFYGYNGAVVNNNGTFYVTGDPYFGASGTTPTFNNNGTFNKSPTTGLTYMYWAFNSPNGSTFNQQSGTLAMFGGGYEGGNFTVAANSTLVLGGGTHAFLNTSSITGGGTVNFQGGNVEVAGAYNLTGTTTVSGAVVSFPNALTSVGSTLNISSGTVDFRNNTLSVANLNLSNGGLYGLADVAVTSMTWTGGTMGGTGSTSVARMQISGTGTKFLDHRTLNVNGSSTWTGGALYGYNGSFIVNNSTFDVQTDQQMATSGDTPLFLNQGTFGKSAGTGTTTVNWLFWNAGTVNAASGTLSFGAGGYSSVSLSPGIFTVAANLSFAGGDFYLSSNTTVSGAGSVDFHGGSVEMVGTYNITGSTTISGATVSFPGTVTSVGSSLTISGGTADFRANNVTTTTGTISGGTMLGTGNVQFTFLTWTGGTMGDTGTTTVGAPGTLAINGTGSKTLDRRTLNLPGTTTDWNGGTIYGLDGAVINNGPGTSSTFAIHTGQQMYWYSGAIPVFNNFSSVLKDDAGVTTISWQFNNSSTTEVDNGALSLSGGGTSPGNFVSFFSIGSSGSDLRFSGGTHNLAASSSITGFNAVEFTGGSVEMAGTYNVNGTPASTTVSGGTVEFLGTTTAIGSTLTVSSGEADFVSPIGSGSVTLSTLTVSGGTLDLFANAVTTPTFNMSGGTLLGTADVGVTNLTWTGGTMGDAGSTTVAANGVLSISGSAGKSLDTRTFNIGSGVTGPGSPAGPIWTGGTIYGLNGAVLNNNTTFDVATDQQLYPYSGDTPVFNNFGSFRKLTTSGTTTIGWQFNNTNNNTDGVTPGGVLSVQSGTLILNRGGTGQGSDGSDLSTMIVASGALLRFDADVYSLGTNSSLTGAGAVDFHGATVEVTGTYNLTGSTTVSSGIVDFPGTLTSLGSSLTISSGQVDFETNNVTVTTGTIGGGTLLGAASVNFTSLTWTGGTLGDTGTTSIGNTLTISGTGSKSIDGRTLALNGSTSWTGGTIYGLNGATINNYGVFTVQTDQQLYWYSGALPKFVDYGTFRKSAGTGTTTVSWVVYNDGGTIDVESGTLALSGGGGSFNFLLLHGSITVASADTLVFGGGSFLVDVGTSMTGGGNVVFSGGTVDIAGTYNIPTSITVSGATVTFPGTIASGWSTLTLSSGTLNLVNNAVSVGSATFSSGMLLGLAELGIGTLSWTGTDMADPGTTLVFGSLTISGASSKTLDGRTLRIECPAATWSGGTIYGYNGASITNFTGSTFTIQTDQQLYAGGGATPVFNNFGTFRKSAGSGTTAVSWVFNNASSATTDLPAGTLSLGGGGTSQGSFTVAANLAFSGGYYQLASGSSVTGAGGVTVSNGTLDLFGNYNVSGTTSVTSGATAEFYSNANTASLTNAGTVVIGDGVTLTLTGSYNQTSGGVTDLFAGTITAGGGVSIGTNSSFFGLGTINGNLTDAGTLSLGFGGSTGILTVNGNYTQTSMGALNMKIGGTTAGTQFDQLVVAGTGNVATLAGTLNVSVINGFLPPLGSTYLILLFPSHSGSFTTANVSPFTIAYETGDVKLTR
jgi:hypothetical protein